MENCDVLVVGAGPAGCAAAYDLAAGGYSVLLLDRAEFPRHKACAGGLTRKTLQRLRYSVEPVTRQSVSAITVERSSGHATTLASRNPVCAMTVREELDHYCLRQTLARGARFARIGPIDAIASRPEGVTLTTSEVAFRARYLIGADGVHSRVRQLVWGNRPAWFRSGFALEAQVRPAAGSVPGLLFAFDPVARGYGWIFPKRDHLNLGLYTVAANEKLDRNCLLAWIQSRLEGAAVDHITGQYLGFGAENALPSELPVLLVGDAGGFADPLTGEGIYGAVASGQAAAAAVDRSVRTRSSVHRVFAEHTAQLRQDLRLSASGARWFYSNLDLGFRALTAPILRRAVIGAYADGTKIAGLASAVRRFARLIAAPA